MRSEDIKEVSVVSILLPRKSDNIAEEMMRAKRAIDYVASSIDNGEEFFVEYRDRRLKCEGVVECVTHINPFKKRIKK